MVQAHRTSSNLLEPHHDRHQTSSNLLEPHHHRDSKVCRVLPHEFGVVRLYRTFSNNIFPGETRCAGCLCTSLGWFKRIEPPRTFSNHIIAEIARCVEFFYMSSGWFDCTEPSLTTSLQGKQGLQGAYRCGLCVLLLALSPLFKGICSTPALFLSLSCSLALLPSLPPSLSLSLSCPFFL